ncbi:MAG: DsbA family protein [Balneolaceae bacterium]
MANQKPVLIYIYDPLCGWCFGFENSIHRLYERYSDEVDFRVYVGGLMFGEMAKPIAANRERVLDGIKLIQQKSDAIFGEPYIQMVREGDQVFDSTIPSRAQAVIDKIAPQLAVPFASELQKVFFMHGADLSDDDTYLPVLGQLSISRNRFFDLLHDPWSQRKAETQIEWAKQAGVRLFPSLVLKQGTSTKLMMDGFRPLDDVLATLNDNLSISEPIDS